MYIYCKYFLNVFMYIYICDVLVILDHLLLYLLNVGSQFF